MLEHALWSFKAADVLQGTEHLQSATWGHTQRFPRWTHNWRNRCQSWGIPVAGDVKSRLGVLRLNKHVDISNLKKLSSFPSKICPDTSGKIHFSQFFFKENIRYPVWICKDPIFLILGTRFSILGTRIRSRKDLKKPWYWSPWQKSFRRPCGGYSIPPSSVTQKVVGSVMHVATQHRFQRSTLRQKYFYNHSSDNLVWFGNSIHCLVFRTRMKKRFIGQTNVHYSFLHKKTK